jgi:hypothetical protein
MSEITDNEQSLTSYQDNMGSVGLYQKAAPKTAEGKVSKLEKPDLSKDETEKLATKRWDQSQAEIKKLEENLQAKVIVLCFSSSLAFMDVDYIFRHVTAMGHQQRIAVFLKGPGGSGEAAARIVFMLRKYCDELIFVVPSEASSACTMMALGGNKILMGPLSMLSPIDTSIAYHPLAPKDKDGYPVSVEITEIQKFIDLCNSTMATDKVEAVQKSPYGLLSEYVHPVFIGAIQRSLSMSKLITTDVLKTHMDDEGRLNYIVDQLNDAFPVHSYPIILEKAQQLGIPAEAMGEETHEIAVAELENIQKITALKSNETEKEKITYTIDAIFETQDLRTVYLSEKKYNLVDNRWEEGTKKADYYSYKATHDDSGNKQIEKVN